MAKIRMGRWTMDLPKSRILRITIGIVLIIVGLVGGFLPILGYWMVPLGLIVLSVDIPTIRRWRRRAEVRFGQWLKTRYPSLAERLGYAKNHKRG